MSVRFAISVIVKRTKNLYLSAGSLKGAPVNLYGLKISLTPEKDSNHNQAFRALLGQYFQVWGCPIASPGSDPMTSFSNMNRSFWGVRAVVIVNNPLRRSRGRWQSLWGTESCPTGNALLCRSMITGTDSSGFVTCLSLHIFRGRHKHHRRLDPAFQ